MSSQFLPMQLSLGRCVTDFSRIPIRSSPTRTLKRIRPNPKCIAILANPTLPTRTAEELQDAYGSQGLNFFDIGGTTTADLKLVKGSKARLVLPTAHVASYKAHMWHGGEEELLHTVRSGKGKLATESLRGGINLRFFEGGDPPSCILPPSTASWDVEDARCEPSNYAQITLTRTSSSFEGGATDADRGCLQFRYVITLTDSSLSSAVVVTNTGLQPVELTGSIVSHLAVSSVEGTFAVGLKKCSYLSLPSSLTQRLDKFSDESNFFPPIWDSETKKRLGQAEKVKIGSAQEFERGCWRVENEDYSELHEGEGRLYPTPPASLTLLDRGFRRSLIVQRLGFQEFWLSNPGPDRLQDWDNFICLGPTQNSQSVRLLANEEWRAAQILSNPGFG